MDRRGFLQSGTCAAVGIFAGFGMALCPEEACARGATAEESTRAKQIFDQLRNSRGSERRNAQSNTFTLAPGEVLTFEQKGYCLDSNLALPSDDEPLAFRPMTRYIAPALRELYITMMRNLASGEPDGIDIQQIIYKIRSEPFESTSVLDSSDFAYLNRVFPNGESLLKTAHRPQEFISDFGLSFWASKGMPGPMQGYSMLRNDGVAGQGIGLGGLSIRGAVANGSTKPFVYDPAQWVLEPARDVQAVAVPLFRSYSLTKGAAPAGAEKTAPAAPKKAVPPAQRESKQKSGKNEPEFAGH